MPYVGHSGFVPIRGLAAWSVLAQEWQRSFDLWANGDYRASVNTRRECLVEAYELQGLDPEEHTPPWLSAGYASNIGHLGFLGMHGIGRYLGILGRPNREVILGPSEGNQILVNSIASATEVLRMRNSSAIVESPPLWPHVESLQMVNANGLFLDFYEFWELTVSSTASAPQDVPVFELHEDYVGATRQRLDRIGLPPGAWFVALHFREERFPRDVRSIDAATMIPAVEAILRLGGRVVQFGAHNSRPLVDHPNYLVAQDEQGSNTDLHPYLLREAEFLLTTNSGPTVVAQVLGTDVVQINTTSISRNTLSTWSRSYYVPLIPLQEDGRPYSLEKLFSSRYAWLEAPTNPSKPIKALAGRSSANEILQATLDMLLARGRTGQGTSPDSELSAQLNELRRHYQAVSFGDIAPSFLAASFS